jgi:hypothetical protein
MAKRLHLTMFVEAAEVLGTDRKTIAGLVKALGITPKAMGISGKAKGLDVDDMALLRKALSVGRENPSPSVAAR